MEAAYFLQSELLPNWPSPITLFASHRPQAQRLVRRKAHRWLHRGQAPFADARSAPRSNFVLRHRSADDPDCAPNAEGEMRPARLPQAAHSNRNRKDSRTTCASLPRPVAARAKRLVQPPEYQILCRATRAQRMAYSFADDHSTRDLSRPEPAEGAGSEQTVDEAIDNFLNGDRPGLAFPDAVAQVAQAVGKERGCSYDAEDRPIVGAGRNRVSGEIGDEESDYQAKDEPLNQKLWHGRRPAGNDGHEPDRPLLLLFDQGWRLHILVSAVREDIETLLQTSRTQRGEDLVFVRKFAVVAAMIGQQHVHDGTGDENEDRRHDDGEPKSGKRDHVSLLKRNATDEWQDLAGEATTAGGRGQGFRTGF